MTRLRICTCLGVLAALAAHTPTSAQETTVRTFSIETQEPAEATIAAAEELDFPSGAISAAQTLALPMSDDDESPN